MTPASDEPLMTIRHLLEALEESDEYWTMEQVDRYHRWIEEAKALIAHHGVEAELVIIPKAEHDRLLKEDCGSTFGYADSGNYPWWNLNPAWQGPYLRLLDRLGLTSHVERVATWLGRLFRRDLRT